MNYTAPIMIYKSKLLGGGGGGNLTEKSYCFLYITDAHRMADILLLDGTFTYRNYLSVLNPPFFTFLI